ncbi:MAG: hypothetical protein WC501_05155 [Candidatus Micrarchaeia archaeon]
MVLHKSPRTQGQLYRLVSSIPPFKQYRELSLDLQKRTTRELESGLNMSDSILHDEKFHIAFLRLLKSKSKNIVSAFENISKGSNKENAIYELTSSIPEQLNGLIKLSLISRKPGDYLTLIANLNPLDVADAIMLCTGFIGRMKYCMHKLSKQDLNERESKSWKFGIVNKGDKSIKEEYTPNSVIGTGVFLFEDRYKRLELVPFDSWVNFGGIKGYLLRNSKLMAQANLGGSALDWSYFVINDSLSKPSVYQKQKIQHELQHIFDYRFGIEGDHITHEYRAMLAELAFARQASRTLQQRHNFLHSRQHPKKFIDSVMAISFLLSQFGGLDDPIWQEKKDTLLRKQAAELLDAAYLGICGLKYEEILYPIENAIQIK